MSSLIPLLSPILSKAVNDVQAKIVRTQTELATNVNPDLSAASAGVILSLSSDISTWDIRTTNLKTANDLVGLTQTALASILSILNQMTSLVNTANSDPSPGSRLNSTYQSLAKQISSIANSAVLNGNSLLGTSHTITIYPALSSSSSSDVTGQDFSTVGTGLTSGYDLTISNAKLTELEGLIQDVTTLQSSMSAYSGAIKADISAATGFSNGLNSYINDLQNVDTTALQANLQNLNNQQSIDYYLISQMYSAAASELAIYR